MRMFSLVRGKKTHFSKFVAQNKFYPPLPDNLYAPLLEILEIIF